MKDKRTIRGLLKFIDTINILSADDFDAVKTAQSIDERDAMTMFLIHKALKQLVINGAGGINII